MTAEQTLGSSKRGSVSSLTAWSYAAQFSGLLTGPLLARLLGADGRGQVAAGLAYGAMSTVVASAGIQFAVGRETARDPARLPLLLGSVRRFNCYVAPLCLLGGLLAVIGPLGSLPAGVRVVTFVMIAISPLGVSTLALDQIFRALGALRSMALTRVLPIVFSAAVVVLWGVVGALTPTVVLVAAAVGSVVTWVVARGALAIRADGRAPLRPLLGFGLRSFVGSVSGFANNRLDQLLMVPLIPLASLGHYAVAVTVANLPRTIGQTIGARAYPGAARGGSLAAGELGASLRAVLTWASISTVALAVVSAVAIPVVYGPGFRESVTPLLWLLPGTVAATWTGAAFLLATAIGRPGAASWSQGLGLMVTCVGLWLVLPTGGIVGAAIVSSCAYIVQAVCLALLLRSSGFRPECPALADLRLAVPVVRRVRRRVIARMGS